MHFFRTILLWTVWEVLHVECILQNHWTSSLNQSCDYSKKHYRFYASKTDYLLAKAKMGTQNVNATVHEDCEAVQLYLFSRHAIRFPHSWDMRAMVKVVPKIRDHLVKIYSEGKLCICEDTINKIKDWSLKMVPSQEDAISETGRKQSHDLAVRLKNKYPSVLNDSNGYNSSQFEFHFSSKKRARQTAEAFASGLNEGLLNLKGDPNDSILQFHVKCDEIMQSKGWSRLMHKEEAEFINGPVMTAVLLDLSERLSYNITYDEAFIVFQTCAFEYAFHSNSIWCILFTESDIKAFEYVDDLRDYYNDAYGHKRNYGQACPAIGHLVNTFRQAIVGPHPKAMLMFSHGKALKKIATSLALFQDANPLLACQYTEQSNRKWRSSLICPFNANIVFVLKRCSNEYYVETLFNEEKVIIKGCDSKLCPWAKFVETFGTVADNCDFDNICSP